MVLVIPHISYVDPGLSKGALTFRDIWCDLLQDSATILQPLSRFRGFCFGTLLLEDIFEHLDMLA